MSFTAIIIIISVLIAIYFYLSRNFKYWSSRGINGPKPVPFVGTFWDMIFKTLSELEEERLAKYGNIYGAFEGSSPMLVMAVPELIKNIMVKDFNIFVNRRDLKLGDPIFDRLLSIVMDDDWKNLRTIISPTFSSGKMKKMHKLVEQCVQLLDKKLENVAKNGKDIEMKKLMGDYTMDVIARCAFAMKTDTHNDPNNPFVKNAGKAFNDKLRTFLFLSLGPLNKYFKISRFNPKALEFFTNAITEIVRQRKETKSRGHHDFIQLMINAQKKNDESKDIDESIDDFESHHGMEDKIKLLDNKNRVSLTDEDILANGLVFFLAGYETTANLLSHLTYCLAIYPECQQKLLEEINEYIDQNGDIDYETISRMPYLDACISETLRLYNPAALTTRVAAQEYSLGETGITVPKGMLIQIPIHAIHHNSQYYPNPHTFNPNRFMPENRDKLIPYTYLPFGAGPRNCVGMRFALMEAKTAIARLITKYKFIRTENTKIPLKYNKLSFQMTPTDITIGIELRNSNSL